MTQNLNKQVKEPARNEEMGACETCKYNEANKCTNKKSGNCGYSIRERHGCLKHEEPAREKFRRVLLRYKNASKIKIEESIDNIIVFYERNDRKMTENDWDDVIVYK